MQLGSIKTQLVNNLLRFFPRQQADIARSADVMLDVVVRVALSPVLKAS